jgi:hypothetical protein
MRRLALPALLLLAACQTPREACQSEATQSLRVLDALIAETQGNLQRGYAIATDQEVRVTRGRCDVDLPDGTEGRVDCEDTDVVDVRRPVAIDLAAEGRELDGLLARRAEESVGLAARLSACQALPDS